MGARRIAPLWVCLSLHIEAADTTNAALGQSSICDTTILCCNANEVRSPLESIEDCRVNVILERSAMYWQY
jgi:hypothetical protein